MWWVGRGTRVPGQALQGAPGGGPSVRRAGPGSPLRSEPAGPGGSLLVPAEGVRAPWADSAPLVYPG